jgi:hypothetical protein
MTKFDEEIDTSLQKIKFSTSFFFVKICNYYRLFMNDVTRVQGYKVVEYM